MALTYTDIRAWAQDQTDGEPMEPHPDLVSQIRQFGQARAEVLDLARTPEIPKSLRDHVNSEVNNIVTPDDWDTLKKYAQGQLVAGPRITPQMERLFEALVELSPRMERLAASIRDTEPELDSYLEL